MPAGSTWSKSRSACCAVSAWIAESTTPTASSAKSPHGRSNEPPPALASNGCSQPTRPAPKWAAPILSPPKSHNHGAEVLGRDGDVLLGLTARDDPQRIVRQRPLQRLRLIPGARIQTTRSSSVVRIHGHGLGMYRLDDRVRRRGQKAVDAMGT